MVLVDSSVWIDYFRGLVTPQTEKLDSLFGTNSLVVGDLILTEVLQGFTVEKQFQEALSLFHTVHLVHLGGYSLSIKAARNYQFLRSKGFTVRKLIDTLIATRCLIDDCELLHRDRDFIPFEEHLGLKSTIPTFV